MKCYYEELALDRGASENEIKAAYKKLALKWHPDKNPERMEAAKERFQLIQQAYEVLSDPQERAWYDNHREQILRGKNSNFEDNCLDLFPYFTVTCFKGFGDDENGFYAVYQEVFKKISTEDAEFIDNEEDLFKVPKFGDSRSSYEDIVGPFYAYWSAYYTKRTYTWLCPYDIREVKDRKILRELEKETRKVAQKAKKERNEEVRNLVSFVRKRDKRVQAFKKVLEERSAFNREKQERNRIEQIKRRQQEIEQMRKNSQPTNRNNDDYEDQLKQLELEYSSDDEFFDNDKQEEYENIKDHKYNDGLYCAACNKEFKTEKSLANHEISRKHRDNIEKLKIEMHCEENFYLREEHLIEIKEYKARDFEEEDKKTLPNGEATLTKKPSKTKSKKEPKIVKQLKELGVEANIDEIPKEIDNFKKEIEEDNENWDVKNKKLSKKNKNKGRISKTQWNLHEEAIQTKPEQNKGDTFVLKCEQATGFACATCKSNFESKNKLFSHLKLTNHAVFLPTTKNANNESTKSGKIKGKRNN